MSLTAKQRLFVDAYLIDLDAKRAAIAAGYAPASAAVEANRLLKHAKVAGEIARRQHALSFRIGITPDKVVAELAKIGFADIRNAVKWRSNVTEVGIDPDTDEPQLRAFNEVVLVDSHELDDATAGAIAEVSLTAQGALRVKLHDKRAALVDIGRHLGMFAPTGRAEKATREPEGKKAQAAEAAQRAGTGRFATPAAPKLAVDNTK